jgi:type IV pilus assembly protein PilV
MRPQDGFTLIEILIAVLVLAVGMLGLAGMQLAGMKSNYSAYLRSQATFAASDLIDRMRVNPGDFAGRELTFDACDDDFPDGSPRSFEEWECVLDSLGLPAPTDGDRASVDCTNGNACGSGNCEIVLRWDDSRGERPAPVGEEAAFLSPIDFFVGTAVADEEAAEEPVEDAGGGEEAAAGRDATTTTFRVCSRLPVGV